MVSLFGRFLRILPFAGALLIIAAVALSLKQEQMSPTAMVLILAGFAMFLAMFLKIEVASLKYYLNLSVTAGLLLAVFAILYLLVQNHSRQWDLTKNSRYSLSPQTQSILERLNKKVRLDVMATSNEPFTSYLNLYREKSKNINFFIHNPYKEVSIASKPGEEVHVNDIWVRSLDKQKRIQFNAEMDIRKLEKEIANAIIIVTQDRNTSLYFVTGHGEKSPLPVGGESGKTRSVNEFAKILRERAMVIDTLDLVRDAMVPDQCDLLVIMGPVTDYNETEIAAIRSYLQGGGSVLAMLDPPQADGRDLLKLRALFSEFGVDVSDKYLADYDSYTAGRNVFVPMIKDFNPAHAITENMQGLNENMPVPIACAVVPREDAPRNLAITPLMHTSKNTWEMSLNEFLEAARNKKIRVTSGRGLRDYPLAVAVSPKVGTTPAGAKAGPRLVIVGDSDLLTDAQQGNAQATFGYFAITWLTHQDDLISIPPRLIDDTPMILKPRQQNLIAILSVVVIPFSIFFGGLAYTTIRRRNR